MIEISAYELAERFIGTKEIPGTEDNPQVLSMLKLDNAWPENDEVPWCSAFANYIAWLLRLPRSKSLLARSWLQVGRHVLLDDVTIGFDVVILSRGKQPQPDATNLTAPGHVGFYAGHDPDTATIFLLGGNQNNQVGVNRYDTDRLLGIRRLQC